MTERDLIWTTINNVQSQSTITSVKLEPMEEDKEARDLARQKRKEKRAAKRAAAGTVKSEFPSIEDENGGQ